MILISLPLSTPRPSSYRYGSKAEGCKACPAGTYFVAVGAKVVGDCGNCPLGTWSGVEGSPSRNNCEGCPLGKRGKVGGQATPEAGCVACTPGKEYQDQTGKATCVPAVCPKSEYATSTSSDVTKKPSCTSCPKGRYGSVPGLVKKEDCYLCSAGKYSTTVGADSPAACKLCPAGQYENLEGKTSCKQCDGGSASGLGAVRCGKCFAGKILTKTGGRRRVHRLSNWTLFDTRVVHVSPLRERQEQPSW